METIKISINLNVDFSENTKNFLQALLKGNATATVEKPKPVVEAKPAEKPVEAKPAEKPVEAKPAAEKPRTATVEKPVSISIDDVRKTLASKIAEHREEIKEKLQELGAPSVTKLDPNKYSEMIEFLNSL